MAGHILAMAAPMTLPAKPKGHVHCVAAATRIFVVAAGSAATAAAAAAADAQQNRHKNAK